ncbi:MAG: beta-ketoacyl-ACP synthase III [Candidatus Izemoplasmatales bacterium]|jgi:3-oxoacyl-[acyl-carrier-protein] synthase-3|nr:beta-ketoacyl-ACP synthase III [Candidatus Izemoplasmatales bacterium]
MTYTKIYGTGSYVPDKIITNEEMTNFVDTSNEWIVSRTGIKERRIVTDQSTLDLAEMAANRAIESANIDKEKIDLIIVATVTSDYAFPGVSNLLQSRLGLDNIMAFDINAACSGFLFAMQIADKMIKSGSYHYALIVGAEVLSRLTDWRDRNTCVLFGDGAGAMVMGKSRTNKIKDILTASKGDNDFLLFSKNPAIKDPYTNNVSVQDHIHMNGSEVFKFASRIMPKTIEKLLTRNKLKIEEINYIVAHQANLRIIDKSARELGVDIDKMFVNIDKYGNTSAASVAIAIDEAIKSEKIKRNDLFLTVAFGGGLTWAGALIEY